MSSIEGLFKGGIINIRFVVLLIVLILSLGQSMRALSDDDEIYPPNPDGITFVRDGHEKQAAFRSASACNRVPCVVTQQGEIKLSPETVKNYLIELGIVHQGLYSSAAIYQTATAAHDNLSERVLNKRDNKKILNLAQKISEAKVNTIYVYGVLLQFPLEEGDMIVITLTNPSELKEKYYYYFRYHRTGPRLDIDVALVNPIGVYLPNKNSELEGVNLSAALSLTMGWYRDPEKDYNFFRKFLFAWRPNFTLGVVRRDKVDFVGANRVVNGQIDGFAGVGFTFLNFLTSGIGVNFFQSPHAFFPYVGVELKNLFEVIMSFKKSRNKKWEEYMRNRQAHLN